MNICPKIMFHTQVETIEEVAPEIYHCTCGCFFKKTDESDYIILDADQLCPECFNELEHTGRCLLCMHCGWSACSV